MPDLRASWDWEDSYLDYPGIPFGQAKDGESLGLRSFQYRCRLVDRQNQLDWHQGSETLCTLERVSQLQC